MKRRFRVGTMPMLTALLVSVPLVLWLVCMALLTEYVSLLYTELFTADIQAQIAQLSEPLGSGDLAERYADSPERVQGILLSNFEHYYGAEYKRERSLRGVSGSLTVEQADYQVAWAVFAEEDGLLIGGGKRHIRFTYAEKVSNSNSYTQGVKYATMEVSALGLSDEAEAVVDRWVNGSSGDYCYRLTGDIKDTFFIPQKIEWSTGGKDPVWTTIYEAGQIAEDADVVYSLNADLVGDEASPVKYGGLEFAGLQELMARLCDEAAQSRNTAYFFSSGARSLFSQENLTIFDSQTLRSSEPGSDAQNLTVVTAFHIRPREIAKKQLAQVYVGTLGLSLLLSAAALVLIYFKLISPLRAASRCMENGWASVAAGSKEPRGCKEPYAILEALQKEREET